MNKYTEQIKAGAAYLDKNFAGWTSKIDLKRLDLSIGDLCILSQAAKKSYDRAIADLRLSEAESPDMGFTIPSSVSREDKDSEFEQLTKEWKQFLVDHVSYSSVELFENLAKLRDEATVTILPKVGDVEAISVSAPWVRGGSRYGMSFYGSSLSGAIAKALKEKAFQESARPFSELDYREIFAMPTQPGLENYMKIDDDSYISLEDKSDPIQKLERGNAVENENQGVYPPTIKLVNVE